MQNHYDIVVIGGGINGTGIARDAAGRGLSVLLLEKDDLAQATSSASTKLIHGGLRYLEHYEFKLVKEALNERENLLKSAPHIIWPIEFILPHEPSLRSKWMIRLGLYFYDFLGKRNILKRSRGLDFKAHSAKNILKTSYNYGFSYADCWVEDSRLVVLCAKDAKKHGATILTRTSCEKINFCENSQKWKIEAKDKLQNKILHFQANCIINAGGPWANEIIKKNKSINSEKSPALRHSQGSHIIIPKLYDQEYAFILQQPDKRIVFAIPYEKHFTLVGTTDIRLDTSLDNIKIKDEEISYLCDAINRSFNKQISRNDVVWSYSGIRPLLDDGDENLSSVTRDYKIELDTSAGLPFISILGGKLTTFRTLSQSCVNIASKALKRETKPWTTNAKLPGGDIKDDYEKFISKNKRQYSNIDPALIERYARAYGTEIDNILKNNDLGEHLGDQIYEAEIRYTINHEWVQTTDDFLWRRSKLGLHIDDKTLKNIEAAIPKYRQQDIQ